MVHRLPQIWTGRGDARQEKHYGSSGESEPLRDQNEYLSADALSKFKINLVDFAREERKSKGKPREKRKDHMKSLISLVAHNR